MSLSEIDKSLGIVVLHQRLVSKQDLDQCVNLMRQNPNQGLGPLLVQCGLIPPNRLDDLLRQAQRHMQAQSGHSGAFAVNNLTPLGTSQQPIHSPQIRSMRSGKFRLEDVNPGGRAIPSAGSSAHQDLRDQYEEYVLGHLLMRKNMISQEQLTGVYSRKGNFEKGAMALGQQLVREGYLQAHLLQPLIDGLRRKIVTCQNCGNCDYREPKNFQQQYPCKRCNTTMTMPAGGSQVPATPPQPVNSGFNSPGMQSGMMGAMQSGAIPMQSGALAMQSGVGPAHSNFGASPSNGFQPSGTFAVGGLNNPAMQSGAMPGQGFNQAAMQPSGAFNSAYGQASPMAAPSNVYPSPGGFQPAPSYPAGPAGAFGSMPGSQVPSFGGAPGSFDPSQPMEPEVAIGGDTCPESFGDYTIEREIARGGMGVVYLANKISQAGQCALKVMLQDFSQNPKRLRRFQREIDAHEKLVHDNIVRILDSGKVDEFYYLTMEFVEGKPLDEKLKEDLELEIVMEMLEKICRATNYAHSMGVVHRDLKPANVLVTPKMIPKLTDFGLAKNADHVSVLTKTGAVVGTPYYLSPEQASGRSKDVDERADVYALGVMMYEMITGRLPFTGKTSVELFRKIIHDDPIPPTKIKPQLTEQIERVCLKALEKKREERYASAGAFADDIRCLIDGKPISARKPSIVKNLVKNVKKKGLGPIVIIGFIVLFLFSATLGTYIYIQSVQQAHETAVATEWEAYESGIKSDYAAIDSHLKEAKALTTIERGQDAIDLIDRATIRLALLEYRVGRADHGEAILSDSRKNFESLVSEIATGDPAAIAKQLEQFKVNIGEWPSELKFEENRNKALKELTNNVAQERNSLLAKTVIARGYAKMVLPDDQGLENAQIDFDHVMNRIQVGIVPATVARGDLFIAKGSLLLAINEYKKATKQSPIVEAYIGWVQALLWQENYPQANQVLMRATKVQLGDEGLAEIFALRAKTAILRGNPKQAESAAKEAVELNPKSYNTWLMRGLLHASLGQHLLARKPFEKALELAGKDPTVLIELTKHYLDRQLYDQALEMCERALVKAPYSMDARAYKAVVYEHMLEFKRARQIAQQVVDNAKVRHWRARAVAAMCLSRIEASHNSFVKANEYARKARIAWPSSHTWLLYGYVLLNHENREENEIKRAKDIGNDVINESKNTVQGHRLVGLAMAAQMKDSEIRRAQNKLFNLINGKLPRDARLRTELARITAEKGENKDPESNGVTRQRLEAIECERDASTLEGNFLLRALALRQVPVPPNVQAGSLAFGDKINKIRTTLRKVNFINPVNVHALYTLGLMAIERSDWGVANKYLVKASQINPQFLPNYLGLLQLRSGANGLGENEFIAKNPAKFKVLVSQISKALKLKADSDFDYLPLAIAQAEFTFRHEAEAKKDEEFIPADVILTLIAAYDKALKSYPNATRFLNPKYKRLQTLRNYPKANQARKDYKQVAELLERIKRQRKDTYPLLVERLKTLKSGTPTNQDFWSQIQLCPNLPESWECLVREAILAGNAEQAIAGLARLSILDPARGDLVIPVLKLTKGKSPDALIKAATDELTRRGSITPDLLTKTLIDLISKIQAAVESGTVNKITNNVNRWLNVHPNLPIFHALASVLANGEKNFKRAILLMANARMLSGDSTLFAMEVAKLSISADDFDTALRLILHVQNKKGVKLSDAELESFSEIRENEPELWKALIESPKAEVKTDDGAEK